MTPTSGTPATGSPPETGDHQSNGCNKNKKKKSLSASTSSFTGKCAEIKEYVYDVKAGQGGFDVFVKTTREIAEHVGSKLKDASEFRNAMDPDNLAFEPSDPPNMLPADAGVMQVEMEDRVQELQ
jgi:hypothetical protein